LRMLRLHVLTLLLSLRELRLHVLTLPLLSLAALRLHSRTLLRGGRLPVALVALASAPFAPRRPSARGPSQHGSRVLDRTVVHAARTLRAPGTRSCTCSCARAAPAVDQPADSDCRRSGVDTSAAARGAAPRGGPSDPIRSGA